nr:ABC transporter substrate-binding protein [Brevibacterium daeguense]
MTASGCAGGSDPLANSPAGGVDEGTLVIGSQQYYSNTIIAEIYAQLLEAAGYDVERDFEIGQREVYASELTNGNIDVFPEYTGALLQYYDPAAGSGTPEEVYEALTESLPEGLTALEPAEATDQNEFVVTPEYAQEHDLVSIGDLAGVDDVVMASSPEFETRPFGPEGLREVYGVEVELQVIDDSGGPLTVNALLDGEVDVTATIYSANPAISEHGLVVLEDPKGLLPSAHLVPVVSDDADDEARAILNEVHSLLSQDELLALNSRSVNEQAAAEVVAREWIEKHSLLD